MAGVQVLRPNTQLSNAWTVVPSSGGSETANWDVLDENILSPTATDSTSGHIETGTDNALTDFGFESFTLVPGEVFEEIRVRFNIKAGHDYQIDLRYRVGGSGADTDLVTQVNQPGGAAGTFGWYSAIASTPPQLTQAELDSIHCRITRVPPDGTLNAVRAAYLEVTTSGPVGASRRLPYGVTGPLGVPRRMPYQVTTSIGSSRRLPYAVADSLVVVGVTRRQPYAVQASIGTSRRLPYSVAAPPVASLTDNFDDNSIDSTKWPSVNGVVETNGTMRVGATTAAEYVRSAVGYTLIGSSLSVEVTPPGGNADGAVWAWVEFYLDAANNVMIGWQEGTLYCRERIGGVNDETTLAFDNTAMKFWRIREAAGTIYWETSPNGVDWTTRRSKAAGRTWNLGAIALNGWRTGSAPTPLYAAYDNVNITYSSVGVSRRLPYGVIQALGASRQQPYQVLEAVGATRNLPYGVKNTVGGSVRMPYNMIGVVGVTRRQPYTVLEALAVQRRLPYAVFSILGTSRRTPYTIQSAQVGIQRRLPYAVVSLVGVTRRQPYGIASALGIIRRLPYEILGTPEVFEFLLRAKVVVDERMIDANIFIAPNKVVIPTDKVTARITNNQAKVRVDE